MSNMVNNPASKNAISTRDIIISLFSIIITSGFFLLKDSFTNSEKIKLSKINPKYEIFKSAPIPKSISEYLIDQYEYNNPEKLFVKNKISGIEQTEVLKGFTFDVAQIEEIIHKNVALVRNPTTPTTSPKLMPDSLIFYLGKNGDFQEAPGSSKFHTNMHMIAMGAKTIGFTYKRLNYNLDPNNNDPTKATFSIYDKASPCPTNCPN